MKRRILTYSLLLAAIGFASANTNPLKFNTGREDIPSITVTQQATDSECVPRGGLPHFFEKTAKGDSITVAFIGGSITQGDFCYRLQIAKYLENKYPNVKFTWVNAGVSGTGTELAVFRVDDQVLSSNPDLVFIEFSVNGGYIPAMEGIIRKIKEKKGDTDICLLYSASEPHMRSYQKGELPEVVKKEEVLASYYNLPSIHMAVEAAKMEADGKLLWKGAKDDDSDKIVFSVDALHPVKEGGNLYAAAIARGLEKISKTKNDTSASLPVPMLSSKWGNAKMFVPNEICHKHGLWKDVVAADDRRMKSFANWFPTVMTSGHPGSTLSFAFNGDMFGFFDIGGPEMGQLEVYVDGQMIRLKSSKDDTFEYFESTPLTGSHYLNRFNKYCNNRYRPQFTLIKVEDGHHQVTLKVSDSKVDKKKILGESQQKDITENPDKYDKTYFMLGKILIRGNVEECKPIKGLPKMEQQLKWEKKIRDYMERDEEQIALENSTLVVGSSSIDMWKSIESDFPGCNVIRRGVSGTKAIDLFNYRKLLIEPFNPKQIIIYEGDNEIGFKWEIDEMMESMKNLFFEIRRMKPEAKIYLVSVKPSPVRVKSLDKIQTFNRQLKEFVESQPNAGFIDIHTPMLNKDGSVRTELFLQDGLHPAKEGYEIWKKEFGKVIKK